MAEFGKLCSWCWQRLNGAVVDVPGTVHYLGQIAEAPLRSPRLGSGGGRVPASNSLYSDALDAADGLAACLGSWADLIVEEHPAGLTGPSVRGWKFTERRVRAVDNELVIEEPTRVAASVEALQEMRSWMLDLLPWVSEQDFAPDMRLELGAALARIKARWPSEDEDRISSVSCPKCGGPLFYRPPTFKGQPVVVQCLDPECAAFWMGDDWYRFVEAVDEAMSLG